MYGCHSHYLDENPVYNNIVEHARHFRIHASRIVLLYAVCDGASQGMAEPLNPDDLAREGIELKTLHDNVVAGRYFKYSGGYGQAAFLIRCDDLKGLTELFAV